MYYMCKVSLPCVLSCAAWGFLQCWSSSHMCYMCTASHLCVFSYVSWGQVQMWSSYYIYNRGMASCSCEFSSLSEDFLPLRSMMLTSTCPFYKLPSPLWVLSSSPRFSHNILWQKRANLIQNYPKCIFYGTLNTTNNFPDGSATRVLMMSTPSDRRIPVITWKYHPCKNSAYILPWSLHGQSCLSYYTLAYRPSSRPTVIQTGRW